VHGGARLNDCAGRACARAAVISQARWLVPPHMAAHVAPRPHPGRTPALAC
jgi:hypothetical protein